MSNKNSNFPSNQINNLPNGTSEEITDCLMKLSKDRKPKDISELKSRIASYFEFCKTHDFRPGIESLAFSLNVTRTGFWYWCEGGKGEEWQEVCLQAKQLILAFLETLSLSGKLNPANSIFYLKNWAGYKDTISFDEAPKKEQKKKVLTTKELQELGTKLDGLTESKEGTLPRFTGLEVNSADKDG